MDTTAMYKDFTTTGTTTACTDTWTTGYVATYPWYGIRDKGTEALNILKALKAKKMLKINDIDDFIEAMSLIVKEL